MKNPKNLLIQDFQQVGNIGLPINNQAVYIPTSAFPNTNLLYGWRNGVAVQGGIALTKNGTIGQAVDHSGATSECEFTGAGYYSSADAAFAFTGSFSVGFWMYRKDWAKLVNTDLYLVGRYSISTGWVVELLGGLSSPVQSLILWLNNAIYAGPKVDHLSSGYHFFSVVRDVTNTLTKFYIDGVCVTSIGGVGSITAAGTLGIGGVSGSGNCRDCRLSDVWIHKGTAWTDAQVKAIYAASCPQASYNQRLAGHRVATVEAGQSASEVLAHYKFGADLTVDEKGTYPLTAVGTPSQAEDIFGNMGALRLNGSSAYYNASLLSTAPSKGIWISLWVKPELYDSNVQCVFGKAFTADSSHNINFGKNSTGYALTVGNGTNISLQSMSTFRIGRWEKFDICWDTINGLRLFVNGVLEATDTTATALPTFNATYPFQIGRYFNGSVSVPFTGSICDFKVMDKVPTQKDIDMAYASTFLKPDGFKGAEIVVRPSADSYRERREKIQCYVDNGTVYRQGMRQLYYDLSDKNLRANEDSGIVSVPSGNVSHNANLLKSVSANSGTFTYSFKDGVFSVIPSVLTTLGQFGGGGQYTSSLNSLTTQTAIINTYNISTLVSYTHNFSFKKQGPDYLPDGFVACNSHDIVQIRGEK